MNQILRLAVLGLILGCLSREPASVPSPAPILPDDVHWVRNSAEHRAAFIQTYRLATRRLEELAREREPGTWAVVLDFDETVLDNSEYEKELNERGESFAQESWKEWILRQEAPPLPGVVSFLERVHGLGGRIAIVTSRRQELCAATEAELRAHGIPFDIMLCGSESREKEPHWEQIRRGEAAPELPPLEILVWLGDKIDDFPQLDQSLRHAPEEAFEEFGESYFILPNPMYGSWVGNPRE
ncbi:MAG: HAD family acid phosphatase [Thermoanaerobaculia bacterium]